VARGRLRRTVEAVLALLLLAIVLVAGGFFPQGFLRSLVERRVVETLGPESRIGSLHVVPAGLRAEIRDLVLAGPGYRLEVPRARLALAPATLLGRGVFLRWLEADSPTLKLAPATEQELAAAAEGPEMPIVVGRIEVNGGTVVYSAPELGELTLRDLAIQGSVGGGTLSAAAPVGSWRGPETADPAAVRMTLDLGPLSARLDVSPLLDLDLESLEIRTPSSRLSASGTLGRIGALSPDVRVEGQLALSEAAMAAGSPGRARGTVSIQATASGTPEAPRVDARLEGSELVVADWPVRRADVRLEHQGSATPESRVVARLGCLGGTVEAEAALHGSRIDAVATFSELALESLARASGTGPPPPVAGTLSGRFEANGDVEAAVLVEGSVGGRLQAQGLWTLDATALGSVRPKGGSIDLRWNTTVQSVAESGPEAVLRSARLTAKGTAVGAFPPEIAGELDGAATASAPGGPVELTLRGTFSHAAQVTTARVDAKGLGGRAELSAALEGARFTRLWFRAEDLDLASVSKDASGQAQLSFEGSGPVDALSGQGRASFADVAWQGMTSGPVTADVQLEAGDATIDLRVPELNLSAHAIVSAGSERAKGTVTLAQTPLEPFRPLAGAGSDLAGLIAADVEWSLPLGRPEGAQMRASVQRVEATLNGVRAASAGPFEAQFSDRRLAVPELVLESDGLRVEAGGSIGLDEAAALDLRLDATGDLGSLPVPAGWTLTGGLSAGVAVSGTSRRPQASGQVALRDLQAEGPSLPPVTASSLTIDLDGGTASVPAATLSVAGGSIIVSGRVPLASALAAARDAPEPGAAEASLRLEWSGVDAGQVLRRVRPEAATVLVAPLSGRAEITGGLASLEAMSARVEIAGTSVRVEETAFRLEPGVVTLTAGRLRTDGLTLGTPGASFTVKGTVDLRQDTIDLDGDGRLELRALSPFLTDAALSGAADLDVHLGGRLSAPQPRGTVAVSGATLRLREFPQPLTGITARLVFDGFVVRIEEARALLGGGTVTAGGSARLAGEGLADVRIDVQARELAVPYPEGLRSRIDADLALTGATGRMRLAGEVRVERAVYDLDVALQQSLRAAAPPPSAESPLLQGIQLDIAVRILNPVQVLTSTARLQVRGDLTLRGDMATPVPYGRLEIPPGGTLELQGVEFDVEGGSLVYEGTWDPRIGIVAREIIPVRGASRYARGEEEYEVTIRVGGTLEQPSLDLQAPGLSEPQVVSLIATGQIEGAALGSAAWVAGEQAAALLAGRLSQGLTEGLEGLGLDEVRIQPELVARETAPGARFTFAKRLTRRLEAIYSFGLGGAESRYFSVEARLPYRATLSVQRRDDGEYVLGAGQEFGRKDLGPEIARDEGVRLHEVRIESPPGTEDAFRRRLRVEPGDRTTIWDLQKQADGLRETLVEESRIEAEVTARLEGGVAVFQVRPGPVYRWRVDGMSDPPDLTGTVRGSLFEEEAVERARERLLRSLRDRGHLRATIEARTEAGDEVRTLVFEVDPGPRVGIAAIEFTGAGALDRSRLLDAAGGAAALVSEPEAATRRIEEAYRARNYLAADVDPPRVEETPGGLRIVVPVREGEPARVASIRVQGATLPEEELSRIAGIEAGSVYDPVRVAAAAARLRDHYLSLGYPSVRVTPRVEATGADMELVVAVDEGEQVFVGSVVFEGITRTREWVRNRAVDVQPGQPLDIRKLTRLENRLLDLGVFARVTVAASRENPSTVTIAVEERSVIIPRYNVRYGTDSEALALVDAEAPNVLGLGFNLGLRHTRAREFGEGETGEGGVDSNETVGTVHTPAFFFGSLTALVSRLDEALPTVFLGEETENHRLTTSFEVHATRPLPNLWSLLYGYSYKHVLFRSFIGDFTTKVSSLNTSVLRDSRDNPTDPRSGRFWSLNVQASPEAIGSDLTFVKGFAQLSVARSLTPSLTWAHAYRLGLGHGFGGQELDCPERFTAGGPDSLRGFATTSLGTRDRCTDPGGQAVLVLNQELRYRHPWGVEAAAFYDAGNVFPRVDDFSLDLRHSVGTGLRWATPVGLLLRLDLGFPLSRQEGEKGYQVFFSVGQAF